ncbi:hypothetical protein [Streptomyces sp. NPDC060027]|uniref:hypothetical protein n=1 Tax=Streptomyces sp. NPDC060027 TaxID=3347040 RepID=UPI0036A33E05
MGVFARLLRRSKAAEEASPAEVETAVQPDGTEAEAAVAAEGSSENEGEATAGTAGTDTAEDVDIPKQQTAEQAADNEAGEGART